jgi:hypothetical protein
LRQSGCNGTTSCNAESGWKRFDARGAEAVVTDTGLF